MSSGLPGKENKASRTEMAHLSHTSAWWNKEPSILFLALCPFPHYDYMYKINFLNVHSFLRK
ncbi:hypothetical protein LEMLEM_LOCUS8390, partial [Lemmus lemmus]